MFLTWVDLNLYNLTKSLDLRHHLLSFQFPQIRIISVRFLSRKSSRFDWRLKWRFAIFEFQDYKIRLACTASMCQRVLRTQRWRSDAEQLTLLSSPSYCLISITCMPSHSSHIMEVFSKVRNLQKRGNSKSRNLRFLSTREIFYQYCNFSVARPYFASLSPTNNRSYLTLTSTQAHQRNRSEYPHAKMASCNVTYLAICPSSPASFPHAKPLSPSSTAVHPRRWPQGWIPRSSKPGALPKYFS